MNFPTWLKGAIFAPTLLLLLFGLKVTCPAGPDCFANIFAVPAFMPVAALYRIFGPEQLIIAHEPIFLLVYWMMVGLLIGLLFDLARKNTKQ